MNCYLCLTTIESIFHVFRHHDRIKQMKLVKIRDNEQYHLKNLSPKKSTPKVTFHPKSLKIVLNL